jgi:hypothetical protein
VAASLPSSLCRAALTTGLADTHTPSVHPWTLRHAAVIAAIFLIAVAGAWAQAAPGATFLGMAVATGISTDANGLTMLQGVHYEVWSRSMPLTEDLQLYTRWSGTGNHTISVTIVDRSTGNSIAETSDDLDFGADPVTYFTHDFSGTSFPSEGAYAIEVTLDGVKAATYAFYVNADDQIPDSPAFVLSVPAESGTVDDRGNAEVEGIFEYFTFSSLPATDSFSIITIWFSGNGNFDHRVQILGPDGKQLAESRRSTLSAHRGRMSVSTDLFTAIAFPSVGVYNAVVFLEGGKVFAFPLVITRK